jgi:glycosyltransferase involved in cell wall biosynthesis
MMADGSTTVPPLVSVLIPAFNHERYVERCLDSVLEDPYPSM